MIFYLVIYKQEKVKDVPEILNYHVLDTVDFDINTRHLLEKTLKDSGYLDVDNNLTVHNMLYIYIDGETEIKVPYYLKFKNILREFIRDQKIDGLI